MAKQKVTTPVVVAEPAIPADALVTQEDGLELGKFVRGLEPFFKQAQALEREALQTLKVAKALAVPTSGEEDNTVQGLIRTAARQQKDVDAHWNITTIAHRFHKRLVAGRNRATDPLVEAVTIGNKLHNTYADAERQRARVEEERLRREAEEAARVARGKELDKLEADALKAEAEQAELSERESEFVDAYVSGLTSRGDAAESAKRAGYRDPFHAAARLLASEKVRAAIEAKKAAISLREQASALRAQPVSFEEPVVSPDLTQGGERTTHSAEVTDGPALIAAVIAGKHGIPWDVLEPDQVKLNEYARSLFKNIDRWPGVRYKKTTRVV